MRVTKLPILAVAIFGSILTTQASADYVYYIGQNYAPLPNGWTLSGQITTDTNTGNLAPSDILSWSYTASNGAQSYTFSSTDSGPNLAISGLIATPSAIELPAPNPSDNNVLLFNTGFVFGGSPLSGLFWERIGSAVPTPDANMDFLEFYYPTDVQVFADFGPRFALNQAPATPTDPWMIASTTPTPEPATLTLLASGLFAAGGFGLYRRRRAAAESSLAC